MKTPVTELQRVITDYDGGVIKRGGHSSPEEGCCALEALSLAQRTKGDAPGTVRADACHTSSPNELGVPDLRCINDLFWLSDAERTIAMLPLVSALSDWQNWPPKARMDYVRRCVVRACNEILKSDVKTFEAALAEIRRHTLYEPSFWALESPETQVARYGEPVDMVFAGGMFTVWANVLRNRVEDAPLFCKILTEEALK